MRREANVVMREGRLMAEVVRTEACQQCHACQFGQTERVYVDLPKGNYREGDMVTLELSEASFSKASLIAYGLPIALLFLGLVVSSAFTDTDWVMAIGAVAGLAVGLGIIKLISPKLEKLRPKICENEDIKGNAK